MYFVFEFFNLSSWHNLCRVVRYVYSTDKDKITLASVKSLGKGYERVTLAVLAGISLIPFVWLAGMVIIILAADCTDVVPDDFSIWFESRCEPVKISIKSYYYAIIAIGCLQGIFKIYMVIQLLKTLKTQLNGYYKEQSRYIIGYAISSTIFLFIFMALFIFMKI